VAGGVEVGAEAEVSVSRSADCSSTELHAMEGPPRQSPGLNPAQIRKKARAPRGRRLLAPAVPILKRGAETSPGPSDERNQVMGRGARTKKAKQLFVVDV